MLTDQFGRRFYYLRLSITDRCNFRCNYCLPDGYQNDGNRNDLTTKEIQRLAAGFARLGTEKIRITGGEPSLRKDLPEIINVCKSTRGIKHVAITTNGFKLPQHLPSWIDAGIDSINVSLDSLDPRQFLAITGHDKFKTIMKGIDDAIEAGIKVKVNAVLLKQYNAQAIQAFINWVKNKPVSMRFIELMETGNNATFFQQQHVSGDQIKQQLLNDGWIQSARHKLAGPAQEFTHGNYQGNIGLIMPYSKDFCASCNRLRVSSKGNLHLCLFAETGLPLRETLQSDEPDVLVSRIENLMFNKKATHELQQGFTGATTHLAMLGG